MSIEVHCSYTRLVPLGELKPNPRNPNTHPESQIRLLAALLQKHGWRLPIVVSARSGFIVKGHGRLEAAKLAGCETAPVDVQEYDSSESEIADLLADNRIPEFADVDEMQLKEILSEFEDPTITSYSEEEIENLFRDEEETPRGRLIKCPNCGFTWRE